jgi:hypothetical protein
MPRAGPELEAAAPGVVLTELGIMGDCGAWRI